MGYTILLTPELSCPRAPLELQSFLKNSRFFFSPQAYNASYPRAPLSLELFLAPSSPRATRFLQIILMSVFSPQAYDSSRPLAALLLSSSYPQLLNKIPFLFQPSSPQLFLLLSSSYP